jgi:hypothetical protein
MIGRHPRRARIEMRLAAGESAYRVGHDYDMHREVVRRHWAEHVSDSEKQRLIRRALEIRPAEELAQAQADATVEPLALCAEKNRILEGVFEKARSADDWDLALQVDRRQLAWVEFQAKLTGPLRKIDSVQLIQNNYGSDERALEREMIAVARKDPNIKLVDFLRQIRGAPNGAGPLEIEHSAAE